MFSRLLNCLRHLIHSLAIESCRVSPQPVPLTQLSCRMPCSVDPTGHLGDLVGHCIRNGIPLNSKCFVVVEWILQNYAFSLSRKSSSNREGIFGSVDVHFLRGTPCSCRTAMSEF